ncbi:MAG: cell division protein ZipA C-terminal FtsZ-binding domain-containing protein [Legionella sp.]|nr:cell division protein ZipA C-terminal FtsZ-binding domain-containing protein [Legionella sp.]
MQANWSLILNVLLLVGVIVAIGRLMKARRQSLSSERYHPSLDVTTTNTGDTPTYNDDIIAVRKIKTEPFSDNETTSFKKPAVTSSQPRLMPQEEEPEVVAPEPKATLRMDVETETVEVIEETGPALMMFLLAKENRQFAGYELLQTVLTAGLRFGEGGLFHRHQFTNGDGPILCSLAAATNTGVFDLQNIGAFSVRGLCLYMKSSCNPGIDAERFAVMLDTAHQLKEGLDAHLLDDQRKPLTEERIERYHYLLELNNSHFESIAV